MIRMESRVIKLTEGAIRNNKLNIRDCGLEFFPHDVLGGCTEKQIGNQITINAAGLLGPIKTDIPTDRKTGKPRWIFRKRSWVKKFVLYHKLRPDDIVRITRINERTYEVSPDNDHKGEDPRQQLMIRTLPANSIICGDCQKVLANFPEDCIDLIVTSTPYVESRNHVKRLQ